MEIKAELPDQDDLMPLRIWPASHPCCLSDDELSAQCDLRTQRRSGPGGQHRNKTSSGVFLLHRITGVTAEATERRSQAENRRVALSRLRMKLAIEVRTASPIAGEIAAEDKKQRERLHVRKLRVAKEHADYPILMAMVLNDLYISGGQPSLASIPWSVGSSAMVRLLKSYPRSLIFVNEVRNHHDRLPLK